MGGSHVQGYPQGTLSSVQGLVGPYVATVSSPCLTVPAGGSLRLDCLCSVARAERPRASRESGMLVPARQSVPRDQPPAGTLGTGPHKFPADRTAHVLSPCDTGGLPPAARPPHVPPSLLSA